MDVDISVVIVNWNTRDLLLRCLASVYGTMKDLSFEVWVVDNGSRDGSVDAVRKDFPEVNIIENNENLGFAAANNRAFLRMNGRYALLLNTDAFLEEGAAEKLYTFMEENQHAAAACGQLLNMDGSRQNSFANFPKLVSLLTNETLLRLLLPGRYPSKRIEYREPIEVDSCIGACMMVRKPVMDEVGIFDEDYFFFFEETDWAYRMRQAGWKIYFIPDARIYHEQGRSAGISASSRIMFYRSRYIFFSKWFPRRYMIVHALIFARLVVNVFLNLVGTLLTLGQVNSLKRKLAVYARLILWHLRGCPGDK